jgi:hypothetical protein
MAPIGLAHRSTVEFVAEWTDVEVQPPAEVQPHDGDRLRDVVDQRRRGALGGALIAERTASPEHQLDEPSPGGWLAGEPMF